MNIWLVRNPLAGNHTNRGRTIDLAALNRLHRVRLIDTLYPRHATYIARDACAIGIDLIIVCGGDGTLGEVISGLLFCAENKIGEIPKLALVPTGTANLIAHELGLSTKLFSQLAQLELWSEKTIWPGQFNSNAFIQSVGLGFDANVVAHVSGVIKKTFPKLAYIIAAMIALSKQKKCMFTAIVDGKKYNAAQLICTTGLHYAIKTPIRGFSPLTEPNLNILIFESGKKKDILLYTLFLLTNRISSHKHVIVKQSHSVYITNRSEDYSQVDGDLVTEPISQIISSSIPIRILVPNN